MGEGLHPLILKFFQECMAKHSAVKDFVSVPHKTETIYRIIRKKGKDDVLVHLSDAYFYGEVDYVSRPSELNDGGFILIARPEATFDSKLVAVAKHDHINLGKLAKLMGALHKENLWEYEAPDEKKQRGATP